MQRRRKRIPIAVATVLAATCFAASCGKQATKIASQVDLRAVLLPKDEHPEGSQVNAMVSIAEAVKKNMLGAKDIDGMKVTPSCIKYLNSIGDIGSLEGWMQFGVREGGGPFFNLVARVPGGGAIAKIKASVAVCHEGKMTLEDRIAGALTYEVRDAPTIEGASTFEVAQVVTFPEAESPEGQAALRSFGFAAAGGGSCEGIALMIERVLPADRDGYFLWILEPNAELAREVGAAMNARL